MKKQQELAVSLLRAALGINVFMHGAVRFLDLPGFTAKTIGLFQASPLPDILVVPFVHLIPFLEVAIGLLVLLGLFTLPALVLGFALIVFLMIGMCVLQNWEIVGIQLNYAVVYALCIYLVDANAFSLDRWLRKVR